jgi:hypothetical protein
MIRPAVCGLLLVCAATTAVAGSSLKQRLEPEYLTMLRKGARRLQRVATPSPKSGEYLDVRCVMHAHSGLSHDSRGNQAQLVAAAKAAGVRAVFMTEHPQADRKWVTEGLRGEKDGVLFVPGAELSDGLLVWRADKADFEPGMKAGPVIERVKGAGGVAFVAHPEQRKQDSDWELPAFDGMEIYNTHADAEDSSYEDLLSGLKGGSPLQILTLLSTLKKFPKESFAAIFDEQSPTLKRWDRLNAEYLPSGRRVIGLAGNDCHQNVGISVEQAGDNLVVKDALGKSVGMFPAKNVPVFLLAGGGLSHTFDPYEVSMGYVSTHVLAIEVTEEALFAGLLRGRAYVAFDWMADPSGFSYTAAAGGKSIDMGGDTDLADAPVLAAKTSAPCELRLLRNGEEVQRVEGKELSFTPKQAGVYRVEAWVRMGEEPRPWIYSNPIYVR